MPRKPSDDAIAQVHAPRFPHDALEVFGNRRGLECLINVLIDAVDGGTGEGVIRASDGSGSEVRVTRLDGRRRPEEWGRSGSPYWDVEDPMIARILDLTEENRRLRQVVASLRCDRRAPGSG